MLRRRNRTAAEWVVRLDKDPTADQGEAFVEWQTSDPRNAAEYAQISGCWRSLDSIGAVPSLAAMADIVEARAKARRAKRRIWTAATGLLAATAAVAVIFVLWRRAPPVSTPIPLAAPAKSYSVLASTARRLPLADGSVAVLNGDSLIAMDFTPAERRVRLLRGEAHFEVAKNPARPFIVSAGAVRIRAVGTAFKVLLTAVEVEVLVTEGKVSVRPLSQGSAPPGAGETAVRPDQSGQSLVAGERGVVRTSVGAKAAVVVDRPAPAEIDAALAWESPRLVFDHTPLDQVVAAFNRYNTHQFVLADPSLSTRTLTGVFRADNFDGFTRLLRASVDVVTEAHGDHETLLRPAQ